MAQKKVERIEIRLNTSNPLDALLLAKLETVVISAPALVKTLLLNYFAAQPGGIGLDATEQSLFADMQPRSAKKQSQTKPQAAGKSLVVGSPAHPAPVVQPVQSSGTGTATAWGPGKLPPCFDTSDL